MCFCFLDTSIIPYAEHGYTKLLVNVAFVTGVIEAAPLDVEARALVSLTVEAANVEAVGLTTSAPCIVGDRQI